MSIRLRLTLLYTAILAVALIVFSVALYVSQSQITLEISKNTLAQQAELFARGPKHPSELSNATSPTQPPQPPPNLPGRWTQLRSPDGEIVSRTADLTDVTLPLSANGLKTVQGGASWYETAQVDNEPLLIYSQPIKTDGVVTGIVQIASPIIEREQSLNTLRLILIFGSGLAILAAFVISWIVGGTALQPIHRITQTAQAIGAEHNFRRRVQYKGPNDEVGQLATTFNTMLSELESAYNQLTQSLESQRRFVADASHELRTPLTTVRGNLALLAHEPPLDAEERAEVMADTQDEVERLIRLVHQLLVLARADAGQKLAREAIPIAPLLEDVCRQAKTLAPERTIMCTPFDDVTVRGDRDALKQVLLILLDNALVHTTANAEISLTTARRDAQLEIRVRDNGDGIPPEAQKHIFERFYRGDASRTGRSTGLGLAIAQELVRAQDGTLRVESELGKGSEFIVTLPLVA
jgi:two-component system OmpR family sensor kinase